MVEFLILYGYIGKNALVYLLGRIEKSYNVFWANN